MSNSKKTFTLNDLELDQVVEIRDGHWFIVCKTKKGVVLSGEHGWINLYELYTDDLTDVDGDYENDIMKVWDVTEDGRKAHAVSPENRELLWKREEESEEEYNDKETIEMYVKGKKIGELDWNAGFTFTDLYGIKTTVKPDSDDEEVEEDDFDDELFDDDEDLEDFMKDNLGSAMLLGLAAGIAKVIEDSVKNDDKEGK